MIEEELKYEMKDSRKQIDNLKRWMPAHFRRIAAVTKDNLFPSKSENPVALTSIYDLTMDGLERNTNTIFPNFMTFLEKKKKKNQSNHYLFLDKVDKEYLLKFLKTKEDPARPRKELTGSKATKATMMEHLSREYSTKKVELLMDLRNEMIKPNPH